MIKKQNQIHPPRPKKACVDALGNNKKRLWLKEGSATILFCKDLTDNECSAFMNHINNFLISRKLKPLPKNKFLITK